MRYHPELKPARNRLSTSIWTYGIHFRIAYLSLLSPVQTTVRSFRSSPSSLYITSFPFGPEANAFYPDVVKLWLFLLLLSQLSYYVNFEAEIRTGPKFMKLWWVHNDYKLKSVCVLFPSSTPWPLTLESGNLTINYFINLYLSRKMLNIVLWLGYITRTTETSLNIALRLGTLPLTTTLDRNEAKLGITTQYIPSRPEVRWTERSSSEPHRFTHCLRLEPRYTTWHSLVYYATSTLTLK